MNRKPIEHGTVAGRYQHLRRNQKPCDECREAYNHYHRTRRNTPPHKQRRTRQRITDLLNDNPTLTPHQLQTELEDRFGHAPTMDTIWRHLRTLEP
jgi:hypothetical protein